MHGAFFSSSATCQAQKQNKKYANTAQGEHGIGLGKKQFLIKELGQDTIDIMRSVKRSLDPYWLLNPGKIFDYSRDGADDTTADHLDSGRSFATKKR